MIHRLRRGSLALSLIATSAAFGCSSPDSQRAASPTGDERNTAIVHEPCDSNAPGTQTVDVNGDGKADIIHVMNGPREVCRIVDLNLDGAPDTFVYYGLDGLERRRESDYDRDGRADEVITLQGGQVVLKERETNYDDKVDTWGHYEGGRLVRRERDSDGDGIIDQWWQFDPNNPACAIVAKDENGDGKPDQGSAVDLCAPQGQSYAPAPAPAATAPETPLQGPAAGAATSTP